MDKKFYKALNIVNSMALEIKCKMNAMSYKENMTDDDRRQLAEMAASYDTLCKLLVRLEDLDEPKE